MPPGGASAPPRPRACAARAPSRRVRRGRVARSAARTARRGRARAPAAPPPPARKVAAGAPSPLCRLTSCAPVVRRFLRDRDVVRVALAETRTGDPDEAGVELQRLDRRRAGVAHRLPEAADELVQDLLHRPLVRHTALDPLGHEPVDVLDVALEVAVLRE